MPPRRLPSERCNIAFPNGQRDAAFDYARLVGRLCQARDQRPALHADRDDLVTKVAMTHFTMNSPNKDGLTRQRFMFALDFLREVEKITRQNQEEITWQNQQQSGRDRSRSQSRKQLSGGLAAAGKLCNMSEVATMLKLCS